MLLAQISDLHVLPNGQKLYDFIDTNSLLARHIAYLNNLQERPDAVVITGDITNFGTPDAYRMARQLLCQIDYPTYLIPGNHDCNSELLSWLSKDYPYLGNDPHAIHYCVDDLPVRLICIDSSVEGKLYGHIGEQRLTWLEERLKEQPDKATAIFTHHHPIPSGCHHMDLICCQDGEKLLELLAGFPQVRHLFCGHTHRSIIQQHEQLLIVTAPGTAHQVPFNTTDPAGFYSLEPPAMLMHRYTKETGMVSFHASLAPFDGPFRFDCVERTHRG